MSELEVRSRIKQLCEELDRKARRLVVPAVLGAGLLMSGGCSDDSGPDPAYGMPAYGVPPVEAGVDVGGQPEYMAPGPDGAVTDAKIDTGPMSEYMGPFTDGG